MHAYQMESIEEMMILNEDLGEYNKFKPLTINGREYVNYKITTVLKWKNRLYPTTIYIDSKCNRREADKVINAKAMSVAQDQVNKLPSPPDLVIWDDGGMRIVYGADRGRTQVTPYFISRD